MDLLPIVDGTVRGACSHDRPDTCSWPITVQGGRAVRLRGDREHPFTSGGLCAKVNSYLEDRLYSPERLLHPLRRIGAKGEARFEQVSSDEALDDIECACATSSTSSGARRHTTGFDQLQQRVG